MAIQRINWLKIVQFHKEIIQCAQKEVFQLPIDRVSKQSTSLDSFKLHDTARPWTIDLQSVRQNAFLNHLKAGLCQLVFLVAWALGLKKNSISGIRVGLRTSSSIP